MGGAAECNEGMQIQTLLKQALNEPGVISINMVNHGSPGTQAIEKIWTVKLLGPFCAWSLCNLNFAMKTPSPGPLPCLCFLVFVLKWGDNFETRISNIWCRKG